MKTFAAVIVLLSVAFAVANAATWQIPPSGSYCQWDGSVFGTGTFLLTGANFTQTSTNCGTSTGWVTVTIGMVARYITTTPGDECPTPGYSTGMSYNTGTTVLRVHTINYKPCVVASGAAPAAAAAATVAVAAMLALLL